MTKKSDDQGSPPEWQALAARFLDLWQDHVQRLAADPDTSEALAQAVQMAARAGTTPPPSSVFSGAQGPPTWPGAPFGPMGMPAGWPPTMASGWPGWPPGMGGFGQQPMPAGQDGPDDGGAQPSPAPDPSARPAPAAAAPDERDERLAELAARLEELERRSAPADTDHAAGGPSPGRGRKSPGKRGQAANRVKSPIRPA